MAPSGATDKITVLDPDCEKGQRQFLASHVHYAALLERPDEPPPKPPETLDVFENQRYMSKLIEWGLEASKRERRRPHLVERDDDEEGRS